MSSETEAFTKKSDYLTPLQVAKKLNTDEETVYRAMKIMYLRRATVRVQSGYTTAPRPMVICARFGRIRKPGILPYRLRSDALDEIAKYLQEQQTKGK